MIDCTTRTQRVDGLTLVSVLLTNEQATPQQVTFRVTIDGPLWPPRSRGVVEPAWDDQTWCGKVGAHGHRGVGFATPARVEDGCDPVTVVESERARPHATDDTTVAHLDAARPPRVTVPCR
jgi:hypothetical protein